MRIEKVLRSLREEKKKSLIIGLIILLIISIGLNVYFTTKISNLKYFSSDEFRHFA